MDDPQPTLPEAVTTDLVVVGGGTAGLLAAVAARRLGHEVLVIEASSKLGGATALSDGRVWLPGNHLMTKSGSAIRRSRPLSTSIRSWAG